MIFSDIFNNNNNYYYKISIYAIQFFLFLNDEHINITNSELIIADSKINIK